MLCDWLPPDFSAVGQYAIGFARELADAGHQVTLVGFSSVAASVGESTAGAGRLRIRRVRLPLEASRTPVARIAWMLRANLALLGAARRELVRADEVRFTGSPAYLLHFVMPIAKALGLRTRYRITDFHPEWLIATLGRTPVWLRPVVAATRHWRRRVDTIEVLGEDQRRRLVECGVDPARTVLRPDPSPVRFDAGVVAVAPPACLAGRRVVLYSGHWGAPHDHRTFVDGYARFCAARPSLSGVWLNAVGDGADAVADDLARRGLAVARTPLVPLADLPAVLRAADLHLITLKDAFVGYALPSKVHACIASGRRILFVGSAKSDVHRYCTEAMAPDRYRRVDVGNVDGVEAALDELLARPGGPSTIAGPLVGEEDGR